MYTEEIANLLLEKFQEERFKDCFLIEIEQKGKKTEIYLDSETGISFGVCHELSRYLESVFDEKLWFGTDYILEVSSPGTERPLKFPRQFIKNIGRTIVVSRVDGTVEEGQIVDADEKKVVLEKLEERKEGKKKIKELKRTEINYNLITEAKIQVKL
ncbi:MAG: ribosome maturation factor [Bacteroidota bacterium]|nr:ribosome maturation factor [Bacteroidota bacterium]